MAHWTDEEIGLITDRADLTDRELAGIMPSRTAWAIAHKRRKVDKGLVARNLPWTPDEDGIIRESAGTLSVARTMGLLPGRTKGAIYRRRSILGLKDERKSVSDSPYVIGGKTLLAKTCTKCGHLLPGRKFRERHRQEGKASQCMFCDRDARRTQIQDTEPKGGSVQRNDSRDGWNYRMEEASKPGATRNGYPYLDSDYEVIEDPNITVLGKAIRLQRTYKAMVSKCSREGASSLSKKLGDRATGQWIIDNPNAESVDEITAALKQEFAEANVPFPTWEWDWDEEDLNTETGVTT